MKNYNIITNPEYFRKLNDLYLKVLRVNKGMLEGRPTAELTRDCKNEEIEIFFRNLDLTLIVIIDRIRQFKIEVLENIPQLRNEMARSLDNGKKLSELIYEYVFSGLAICFLDSIMKNKGKFYRFKATITTEVVWEIFLKKSSELKIPQLHDFFTNPMNSEVSSMFNLMFDSMYDRVRSEVEIFSTLKDNLNLLVKEIIEKSIIEGMLLFKSYEEAILQLTDMRINI